MDLRTISQARRGHATQSPGHAEAARRRALRLAGLCIAAFECSQLVFQSPNCPAWADISDQMACARIAPASANAGQTFGTDFPVPA